MKIGILVGHGKSDTGGYDPGAVCDGYHEFKIAREIARCTQWALSQQYECTSELINYSGNMNLEDRINKVHDKGYDFVAEIHLNAGGGTGSEAYYSVTGSGKAYAEKISENISSLFNIRNRGAKLKKTSKGLDYFGIIRRTECVAVLVETVFIDTPSDLEKVKTADGCQLCGFAIAKAIGTVGNLKEKSSEVKTETVKPDANGFTDGEEIKLTTNTYYNGKLIPAWVLKSKLYYRGTNKNGVIFSTRQTGEITGVVNGSYVQKVHSSELKIGDEIKLLTTKYFDGSDIPEWVLKSKIYYRGTNKNGVIISVKQTGAITGVIKSNMFKR